MLSGTDWTIWGQAECYCKRLMAFREDSKLQHSNIQTTAESYNKRGEQEKERFKCFPIQSLLLTGETGGD